MKNSPKQPVFILSGELKRAKLLVPPAAHPMGARERLALFNVINPANARVLDLFAGSGALGLEALSRGATAVTLVDQDTSALKSTLRTLALQHPRLTRRVQLVKSDALRFTTVEPYDLVLVDPPYDHPEFFQTSALTAYANLVKSGGSLVLSRPKNTKITPPDNLTLASSRQYAGLSLDFFDKL